MEKNSCWQAKSLSTSQETSRLLWNPNIQFRDHSSPPSIHPEPHESRSHRPTQFNIHFNIILPCTRTCSEWFLPLTLPDQTLARLFNFPQERLSSQSRNFLDFAIQILSCKEYKSWSPSSNNFLFQFCHFILVRPEQIDYLINVTFSK
jgi:hypothetical protein